MQAIASQDEQTNIYQLFNPQERIDILERKLAEKEQENQKLKAEIEDWRSQFQPIADKEDLFDRTRTNKKMAPSDRLLYMSFVDKYPGVLTGETIEFEVFEVRANAGWLSGSTATKFFQAFVAAGAGTYEAGQYIGQKNERKATFTANLEVFLYPEDIDMLSTERREKERQNEQARREKYMSVLISTCEECGSTDIEYSLKPTCKSCKHVHIAVEHIDKERITIKPEEGENLDTFDEWVNEIMPTPKHDLTPDVNEPPEDLEPPDPTLKRKPRECTCYISLYWGKDANGKPYCTKCSPLAIR